MASQILITGATGFIGRQLTRDLAGQGLGVRVLARARALKPVAAAAAGLIGASGPIRSAAEPRH